MKKSFFVNNNFLNSRLDKWFKKTVCNIPQSLFEKNIRKGKIKVNSKGVKSFYKLKVGDLVSLYDFNPKSEIIKIKKYYKAKNNEIKSTSKFIIEDNENFVIVNKPRGIAVQSGTKSKRNLLDILRKSKYFINSDPFTVHRIDKDTTGVLMFAKNRNYAQLLTSLFRLRKI